MAERDDQARRRDAENRELFAIRRDEERLAAEERRLERRLKALEEDDREAERSIEHELLREHWSHAPDRPLAWRTRRPRQPEPEREA